MAVDDNVLLIGTYVEYKDDTIFLFKVPLLKRLGKEFPNQGDLDLYILRKTSKRSMINTKITRINP